MVECACRGMVNRHERSSRFFARLVAIVAGRGRRSPRGDRLPRPRVVVRAGGGCTTCVGSPRPAPASTARRCTSAPSCRAVPAHASGGAGRSSSIRGPHTRSCSHVSRAVSPTAAGGSGPCLPRRLHSRDQHPPRRRLGRRRDLQLPSCFDACSAPSINADGGVDGVALPRLRIYVGGTNMGWLPAEPVGFMGQPESAPMAPVPSSSVSHARPTA